MTIAGVNTGQRITGSYDLAPAFYRVGGATMGTPTSQLNPAAFYPQAIGDIAPTPVGYLSMPGFINHDIAVFKNISVWKERYLQFRVEMFNALNNTEFSGVNFGTQLATEAGQSGGSIFSSYPTVNVTNNLRPAGSKAPLGQYFGEFNAARDPRIIQLGVKLYF
jgi:hypothetical protein